MDKIDEAIALYKAKFDALSIPYQIKLTRNGDNVIAIIQDIEAHKIAIPDVVTHIEQNKGLDWNSVRRTKTVRIGKGVQSIGKNAFHNYDELEEVILECGNNLRYIGEDAFYSNESLKEFIIPDSVEIIENGAFSRCTNCNVVLGKGIREIKKHGLYQTGIVEMVLPTTMSKLEEYTFSECKKLKKVAIPLSIGIFGMGAFMHCEELEEATFYGKDTSNKQYILNKAAFAHCNKLKEIEVPGKYHEIRVNAFEDCWALEKVVLQKGVQTIKKGAFNRCKGLKAIYIPEGTTIEMYAFPMDATNKIIYY